MEGKRNTPSKKTNPVSTAITIIPEKTMTESTSDVAELSSLIQELTPKQQAMCQMAFSYKSREDIAKMAQSTVNTFEGYFNRIPAFRKAITSIRSLDPESRIRYLQDYNVGNAAIAMLRRREILSTPYKDQKSDAAIRTLSAQIDAAAKGAGVDKVTPTIGNQYNYTEILAKEINING